jgi:hypothetical protein
MLKDAAGNMQAMNTQPMIFLTRNFFFPTDDAFHEGGGSEVINLPLAELAALPQIVKVGTQLDATVGVSFE